MLKGVDVVRARSLEEALSLMRMHKGSCMPIAGGTDVVVALRRHPRPGTLLVDLSKVGELKGVRLEGDEVVIGALTTHQEAVESGILRIHARCLAAACAEVGSVQIRNRGTIGGNVVNASPCADALTALVGLGADAVVQSLDRGSRRLRVEELVAAPYKTRLEPDELVVEFRVKSHEAFACSFMKLGRRNALAISRINAACAVRLGDDGRIVEAKLAAGSVMPRTSRIAEAESALVGETPSGELAARVGEIVARKMVEVSGVRWSTPYKEPAVKAVIRRLLTSAFGIEEQWPWTTQARTYGLQ